jgi:hypothetical protein
MTTKLSRYRTTVTGNRPAGTLTVRYVVTDILKMWTAGNVTLNSGGYRTVTTKRKINQASAEFGLGISVWQKDHVWYVRNAFGVTQPFRDGMAVACNA